MNQGNEKKAVFARLDTALSQGKQGLAKEQVTVGDVRFVSHFIHNNLKSIFGDEADLDSYFLEIPGGLSPTTYAAILRRRVNGTSDFLNGIRQCMVSSYGARKGKVFFGHGRSPIWRVFKDFVQDELKLRCDEFNHDVAAGMPTVDRLSEMLSTASFAFLVMTAEDEHADKTTHARENVVHEIGLCQGRLGTRRAIILREDACHEFSNIVGTTQIPFNRMHAAAAFHDMRRALVREGLLES